MTTFGERLRELMNDRGVSLKELARQLPVDKGYLSRVRNGHRPPSPQLAEALDRKLGADGELIALGAACRRLWRSEKLAEQLDGALTPDDEQRLLSAIEQPGRVDDAVIAALTAVLAGQRRLEDLMGPKTIITPVAVQLRAITGMLRETRGPNHGRLGQLVAEWTLFTGWLHAAVQQERRAFDLFGVAGELADDFETPTIAAQAASFRGSFARRRGRHDEAVQASSAALAIPGSHPTQQIHDMLHAARGYAALGEGRRARRLLEDAAGRIDGAGEPPPCAYWYTAPFLEMYAGVVMCELGNYRDGADLLRMGIDHMPAEHRNAEWMGEYRDALSVAQARG